MPQELSRLFLTTFSTGCNRGQIYPETENKYSMYNLVKVLNDSGLAVDTDVSYESLVELLISQLNFQKPATMYALDDGTHVLIESRDVVLDGGRIRVGPAARLKAFDGTPSCEKARHLFLHPQNSGGFSSSTGGTFASEESSDCKRALRRKDRQIHGRDRVISDLEEELAEMEAELSNKQRRYRSSRGPRAMLSEY